MDRLNQLVKCDPVQAFDFLVQDSGIIHQPDHFFLGAAVAQLQVVQHGVVLFRKTLIRNLDGAHIRAHLVCVIRHILDGRIGKVSRSRRVSLQALKQACGEPGDRFHVIIRGKPRCPEALLCVGLHLPRGCFEQGFHTADQLLIVRVGANGFPDYVLHGADGLLEHVSHDITGGNRHRGKALRESPSLALRRVYAAPKPAVIQHQLRGYCHQIHAFPPATL